MASTDTARMWQVVVSIKDMDGYYFSLTTVVVASSREQAIEKMRACMAPERPQMRNFMARIGWYSLVTPLSKFEEMVKDGSLDKLKPLEDGDQWIEL